MGARSCPHLPHRVHRQAIGWMAGPAPPALRGGGFGPEAAALAAGAPIAGFGQRPGIGPRTGLADGRRQPRIVCPGGCGCPACAIIPRASSAISANSSAAGSWHGAIGANGIGVRNQNGPQPVSPAHRQSSGSRPSRRVGDRARRLPVPGVTHEMLFRLRPGGMGLIPSRLTPDFLGFPIWLGSDSMAAWSSWSEASDGRGSDGDAYGAHGGWPS